jgi:hypothetical protein
MSSPMYIVQYRPGDGPPYKTEHGSHDAEKTICGLYITSLWVITNNRGTGTPTCKKCIAPPVTPSHGDENE